jgi:hypothetical protein
MAASIMLPARDALYPTVRSCLEADGWRITHDPYTIPVGRRNLFVDLGAEKFIGAEREDKRIAVEVKSFQSPSEVHDLEEALYLAIPKNAYTGIFEEPLGKGVLTNYPLRLLVIDDDKETIFLWIPEP